MRAGSGCAPSCHPLPGSWRIARFLAVGAPVGCRDEPSGAQVDEGHLGRRVRERRLQAGLGQSELAARAEMSRQSVGALESGRHLPRVDAALRLARALGTSVEDLLAAPDAVGAAVGVLGSLPAERTPVRLARVRDRAIAVPATGPAHGALFAAPDAVVEDGSVHLLDGGERDGFVVAGCDPALGLLAALAPPTGPGRLLPVVTTTAAATDALLDGRVHAALVHGRTPPSAPDGRRPLRVPFASWRTGLALAANGDDLAVVLDGRTPVIQREAGAAAQTAYERGAAPGPVDGPRASSHLDAAHRALASGHAAVTIEPAAAALGLDFHPLETHAVELWVAAHAVDHPGARVLSDLLAGPRLRTRLAALPAYEPAPA